MQELIDVLAYSKTKETQSDSKRITSSESSSKLSSCPECEGKGKRIIGKIASANIQQNGKPSVVLNATTKCKSCGGSGTKEVWSLVVRRLNDFKIIPIDDKSQFERVALGEDNKPYCLLHGAMNRVSKDGLYRCLRACDHEVNISGRVLKAKRDCFAGCKLVEPCGTNTKTFKVGEKYKFALQTKKILNYDGKELNIYEPRKFSGILGEEGNPFKKDSEGVTMDRQSLNQGKWLNEHTNPENIMKLPDGDYILLPKVEVVK